VGLRWNFSPFCGARGADVQLSRVAAFRPAVLALRGGLRGAPPSAARLRRDGSRKRKRQKIATSQEQRLLPRVPRVQRSRIAASSKTLSGRAVLRRARIISGRRAASRTDRGAMIGDPPRDGGLELFKLFNLSRRSSSAIRAVGAALPAACAVIGTISSSLDGSPGASRILRLLDPKPSPPSRKIHPAQPDREHLSWAVAR
jgi:hypothetical protein